MLNVSRHISNTAQYSIAHFNANYCPHWLRVCGCLSWSLAVCVRLNAGYWLPVQATNKISGILQRDAALKHPISNTKAHTLSNHHRNARKRKRTSKREKIKMKMKPYSWHISTTHWQSNDASRCLVFRANSLHFMRISELFTCRACMCVCVASNHTLVLNGIYKLDSFGFSCENDIGGIQPIPKCLARIDAWQLEFIFTHSPNGFALFFLV